MVKKIKVIAKTPAQVKKDMAIFEKGVERLKELERELNDLDTRGFARDEQRIRIKLKNVSDIPVIEEEIKALRLKINNKFKPKRKRKSKVVEQLKDLNEKLETIEKASKVSRKKSFVDSGVGVLVDTDFNNFLTDVKTRLSERVRGKEEELDEILKSDLQKRELDFKRKHDNLIAEFNSKKKKLTDDFEKKFDAKVKSSLQKEVSEKFNVKLKAKLDSEKVALGKRYKSELKLHADEKLKREEQEMKAQHDRKIEALEKSFALRNEKLERELVHKYDLKLKDINEQEKKLREKARVFELERERKAAAARGKIDSEERKMIARNDVKMRALEAKERALEEKIKNADLKEKKKIDSEERKLVAKNDVKVRALEAKERALEAKEKSADLKEKEILEAARLRLSEERKIMVAKIKAEEKEMAAKIKREESAIIAKVGIRERMLNAKIAKNVELSKAYEKKAEENHLAFIDHVKKLDEDKEREIGKIKRELSGKFHIDLNAELVRKEGVMRAQLKNEYDLLLKQKIQEHESELKRKKLDLELEIQRKMKEALA
ncbi:MAG: hypothetical protein V1888_02970 [archaeon]